MLGKSDWAMGYISSSSIGTGPKGVTTMKWASEVADILAISLE